MNKLEQEIQACTLCPNLEKLKYNTISYGTNKELLFIGESPAEKGWITTGKAFYNIDNKLLSTGKVLNKLLELINLTIDDITFTEACKCCIPNRKILKQASANCWPFLEKQINELKPKIIIPLGAYPTRIILKDIDFKKFSDVVGKVYNITINNDTVSVIPIYHPSPINPRSFQNNIPIFELIKTTLNDA